ncbi:hypothetical protein POM88_027984 [Heracleum sosnowskyi]|uniref:Uncharacterized protein n=1 Tax=Heracleum sosnowskyi TaxID=360622 RepID=A0AAD8MLZ1_9APIA|nr:hypothetical protein POM88_027984 [Heracleum sosnowskyi]
MAGQIYPSTVKAGGRTTKQLVHHIQFMVRALSFFCLLSYAEAQEYSTTKIGSQIWLLISFMVLMAVGGASTSNGGGGSGRGRARGRGRGRGRGGAGATGRVDGGDIERRGARGRGDGGEGGRARGRVDGGDEGSYNEDVMETENGGIDDEEDIASIVQRFQRNASQGDHQKRPINGGPKLGTVHFIDGCIVEPRYKKTLLAIIRTLWDKDTVNTSGITREAFLDSCAIDLRVYYKYECTDEEGDRYVKAHIRNNWKQLLSKEKTRANERVRLAKSLGYTHATRAMELDAKLETPVSNLEFFKYIYNIDEPTIKKIMEALEAASNSQPEPEEPLSPDSQRKRDLCLLMQARKPKKNKVMLFPRSTLSELIGADEAARLNPSQSTRSSQTSIPDNAYSIIRRVLSEVTTAVSSMESLDQVPRTQLNEVLEKLATTAFPDRADPIQQSSWDQYMRIAGEVIDQVMHNCKKAIVEDNQSEMDRVEQDRLLLEMDFGRENDDSNLFQCPLYEYDISIFNHHDDQNFEVKEIGVYLVYEEQEQAGVHLGKHQKIQQPCDKISHCVVPVKAQPLAYHGITQLYFIGYPKIPADGDSWLDIYFGKYTGDPSSPVRELE